MTMEFGLKLHWTEHRETCEPLLQHFCIPRVEHCLRKTICRNFSAGSGARTRVAHLALQAGGSISKQHLGIV